MMKILTPLPYDGDAVSMRSSTAQQIALDNALVAPENRVKIGICNIRIDLTKTPKEPTYQVVLDALALTTCYLAFLITVEVPEIYMHQFWHTITNIKNLSSYKFKLDEKKCTIDVEVFRGILQICPRLPNHEFVVPPSSDLEIVSFIKELRCLYRKTIGLDKIRLLRAQILWGMYYNQNVDFVELLLEDFMFQIDNEDSKKQEKMYYPRFTKAIIQHFISKDKSISMRNILFMHTVQDDSILGSLRFVYKTKEYQVYGALIPVEMTNLKMQNSPAYKTYLAYATGATPPKKDRKLKKPTSSSKKKTLVVVEEPAKKFAKNSTARRQSAGVQIRDTPGVSVSIKKAIKQSKWETNIHQAGGSSEGASLEPEVPDEQKGKSIDTSEGNGLKPGIPDRISDDEEETQDDEFVHTPKNYVPTNDETNDVDDDEYDRINKEMYNDVNVELKDTELESERKDDEEMTDTGHVDAEHENVNQEVAGDQVKDVDQATVTTAPATQKTEVPLLSSSISSDYAAKFFNFDNILWKLEGGVE
ncbi:hypothetical protein Tco_0694186 [Tanacetum coccineum]